MRRLIRTLALSGIAAWGAVPALAEAPPTTTGENNPNPPGTFPTTVTAANINVSSLPGSVLNGGGSDDLKVAFPSAGPIKWTSSRFNEGDLAVSVGPFDPNDPSYYPPDAYGQFKPGRDGQPFTNATLAWRLAKDTGATLVSVRTNGYTPDVTFNGQQVGTLHGTAYAVSQGSQGYGYRVTDGVFENGGGNSIDVVMGIAGYDEAQGESAFNLSTAYFPYEEGWRGGWVNSGDGATNAGTIDLGHPELIGSNVATWQDDGLGGFSLGNGRVVLPNVDSANDGMLFVAPSSDRSNNQTNIAAAAPRDGGWDVTVYADEGDGFGAFPINAVTNSSYQFLYVPYQADGLVGGWIDGETGDTIKGSADSTFNLEKVEEGVYSLGVIKPDSALEQKYTEDEGMLVLSVASHNEDFAAGNVAARTMLSYEWDEESGDFIIQSRIDAGIEGGTSIFGDLLELTDTDFYFAWISFTDPMSPNPVDPGLEGDTNDDGVVDLVDLNNVRNNFGGTGLGDTNGDNLVDLEDLNAVRNNFGATGSPTSVPEPATWLLGLVGLAAAGLIRRRR